MDHLLNDFILVELPPEMPAHGNAVLSVSKVVAVSETAENPPAIGDTIAYDAMTASHLVVDDVNHLVIRSSEVVAVIEPAPVEHAAKKAHSSSTAKHHESSAAH